MDFEFQRYQTSDLSECLSLFDANCPAYFAPNEREDYCAFLDGVPASYTVIRSKSVVVGAFGLAADNGNARLSWIMLDPSSQRSGIGSAIMAEATTRALELGAPAILIAASHLSAPFFARFDAAHVRYIRDGWGPGMHRVDMVLPLVKGEA